MTAVTSPTAVGGTVVVQVDNTLSFPSQLSSVVRGEQEQAKFSYRLRALDLLNQMEAIYIQRSEHRQENIVKLIIEEEDPSSVKEG